MINKIKLALNYIDYYIPREVVIPVLIVFGIENITEILFNRYMPVQSELIGWFFIILIVAAIGGLWGEADDDKEEFEEDIQEMKDEM